MTSTQETGGRPVSRRRFLQIGGAAGATAFLAACGGTSKATPTPAPVASEGPATSVGPASPAPITGTFRMATWIGYIDVDPDDNSNPSLDRFATETGVSVEYQEVVDDNEEFFVSDLQGPIEAGVPTGWDLVVLTDWMVQRLASLGWIEPIDVERLANYPENLEKVYQGRTWDPGNTLCAPYVSGMTGLGYDQKVTGPLTSIDVLFGDDWAGRTTYLTEMNDTVGLSALRLGHDPDTLTQAQFDESVAAIKTASDAGIVRRFTGNDYVQDLISGDVVLAMAWSGDVAGTLLPLNSDASEFVWTLPEEGGMIWTDNMVIPKGARQKAQAEVFIDWYYVPANAAQIIAAVLYVCPVVGAADAISTIDPALAENPLIFPTAEMRERLSEFVSVEPDIRSAWEKSFTQAIGL